MAAPEPTNDAVSDERLREIISGCEGVQGGPWQLDAFACYVWAPSEKGGDFPLMDELGEKGRVAELRGWGYYTGHGHGALGLDPDEGKRRQKLTGEHVARLDPATVKALATELLNRRSVTSQASEGEALHETAVSELRILKRTLEMQAHIMRDPARTGGWVGAERVANAFDSAADRLATILLTQEPSAAAPASPSKRVERLEAATHRHVKRGTEYVLLGNGKMQAENWHDMSANPHDFQSVDMREVAIYRSVDDGSLWVRPREEFEDGRFQALQVGRS